MGTNKIKKNNISNFSEDNNISNKKIKYSLLKIKEN